jgi:hypothetical protein
MGEYRGCKEEIDDTESLKEARYLLREYKIAYGGDWRIWIENEEEDGE